MKNVRITNTALGLTSEGLKAQIVFGDAKTNAAYAIGPFCVNAEEIAYILDTAGVSVWEALIGTNMQIEEEDGKIKKIYNILDEEKVLDFDYENTEKQAAEEVVAEVVEESAE